MADDPKAGTTEPGAPGGGTPAGTGAATEAADGAEGGSKPEMRTVPAAEYHALQGVAEEKNAALEENARLKAELAARTQPPTTGGAEADEVRRSIEEDESYIARLRISAQSGNEDAKALIKVHDRVLSSERRTLYALEMARVPESDQAAVKKLMADTGAPSPLVAYRLLRGDQYESLAQKAARLESELAEARKPRPIVEDTRAKGAVAVARGSAGGPEEITPEEYDRRMHDNPAQTIADRKSAKFKIVL